MDEEIERYYTESHFQGERYCLIFNGWYRNGHRVINGPESVHELFSIEVPAAFPSYVAAQRFLTKHIQYDDEAELEPRFCIRIADPQSPLI